MINELKEKLADFGKYIGHPKEFAEFLMQNFVIRKGDAVYEMLEIEFYYFSKEHQDFITYPRSIAPGRWFFHQSGVDLSLKSTINYNADGKIKIEGSCFGGILIRSILKKADGKRVFILGPMKCVDELWDNFDAFTNDGHEYPIIEHRVLHDVEIGCAGRFINVKEDRLESKIASLSSMYDDEDANGLNATSFNNFKKRQYRFVRTDRGGTPPDESKKKYKAWPKRISTNTTNRVIYMSELLSERYSGSCRRLTDILDRHGIEYRFLKETKDIWCRDYMPVQTKSGRLVQFRYDPSYLNGNAEYEASRSDVQRVCEANGISPVFSDINLDGGNVLICGDRAIVSDRVFSENPERDPEALKEELARLLEAEIIIIPALNGDYTGHADAMVRFVTTTTILGNDRSIEYKYWKDKMNKVLTETGLSYIDVPFFYGYKDRKHPEHAIGIYVNYLEAGNLIVIPRFGVDGNKDDEALAKFREIFPDKTIETIDYNEVALEGGILNCSTWTVTEQAGETGAPSIL